jgi:hypothetical protein
VGVGLFVTAGVCAEDIVAIEDCEFDRAGLPGLTAKNGAAGETIDGVTVAPDTLARDGEAVFIGVGIEVSLPEAIPVEMLFVVMYCPL